MQISVWLDWSSGEDKKIAIVSFEEELGVLIKIMRKKKKMRKGEKK